MTHVESSAGRTNGRAGALSDGSLGLFECPVVTSTYSGATIYKKLISKRKTTKADSTRNHIRTTPISKCEILKKLRVFTKLEGTD